MEALCITSAQQWEFKNLKGGLMGSQGSSQSRLRTLMVVMDSQRNNIGQAMGTLVYNKGKYCVSNGAVYIHLEIHRNQQCANTVYYQWLRDLFKINLECLIIIKFQKLMQTKNQEMKAEDQQMQDEDQESSELDAGETKSLSQDPEGESDFDKVPNNEALTYTELQLRLTYKWFMIHKGADRNQVAKAQSSQRRKDMLKLLDCVEDVSPLTTKVDEFVAAYKVTLELKRNAKFYKRMIKVFKSEMVATYITLVTQKNQRVDVHGINQFDINTCLLMAIAHYSQCKTPAKRDKCNVCKRISNCSPIMQVHNFLLLYCPSDDYLNYLLNRMVFVLDDGTKTKDVRDLSKAGKHLSEFTCKWDLYQNPGNPERPPSSSSSDNNNTLPAQQQVVPGDQLLQIEHVGSPAIQPSITQSIQSSQHGSMADMSQVLLNFGNNTAANQQLMQIPRSQPFGANYQQPQPVQSFFSSKEDSKDARNPTGIPAANFFMPGQKKSTGYFYSAPAKTITERMMEGGTGIFQRGRPAGTAGEFNANKRSQQTFVSGQTMTSSEAQNYTSVLNQLQSQFTQPKATAGGILMQPATLKIITTAPKNVLTHLYGSKGLNRGDSDGKPEKLSPTKPQYSELEDQYFIRIQQMAQDNRDDFMYPYKLIHKCGCSQLPEPIKKMLEVHKGTQEEITPSELTTLILLMRFFRYILPQTAEFDKFWPQLQEFSLKERKKQLFLTIYDSMRYALQQQIARQKHKNKRAKLPAATTLNVAKKAKRNSRKEGSSKSPTKNYPEEELAIINDLNNRWDSYLRGRKYQLLNEMKLAKKVASGQNQFRFIDLHVDTLRFLYLHSPQLKLLADEKFPTADEASILLDVQLCQVIAEYIIDTLNLCVGKKWKDIKSDSLLGDMSEQLIIWTFLWTFGHQPKDKQLQRDFSMLKQTLTDGISYFTRTTSVLNTAKMLEQDDQFYFTAFKQISLAIVQQKPHYIDVSILRAIFIYGAPMDAIMTYALQVSVLLADVKVLEALLGTHFDHRFMYSITKDQTILSDEVELDRLIEDHLTIEQLKIKTSTENYEDLVPINMFTQQNNQEFK